MYIVARLSLFRNKYIYIKIYRFIFFYLTFLQERRNSTKKIAAFIYKENGQMHELFGILRRNSTYLIDDWKKTVCGREWGFLILE